MLAILAQTLTAIPASGPSPLDDLKAQFLQTVIAAAGAFAVALLAWLRTWLRARLAEKLTTVAITGVENASGRIEAILKEHLGPQGIKALSNAGVDLDVLRRRLVDATKQSVQAVSIDAGTEQKLAPLVAKVTESQRLVVDVNGDPIKK